MHIQFHGAAGEVTGSCHILTIRDRRVLLDCGLIQGSRKHERRNRDPWPFDPSTIDAVILSHAHIDHSGRLPLLVKDGYRGPVYAQNATRELCRIMLRDCGFIAEKEAEIISPHILLAREWRRRPAVITLERRMLNAEGNPAVAPVADMQDIAELNIKGSLDLPGDLQQLRAGHAARTSGGLGRGVSGIGCQQEISGSW